MSEERQQVAVVVDDNFEDAELLRRDLQQHPDLYADVRALTHAQAARNPVALRDADVIFVGYPRGGAGNLETVRRIVALGNTAPVIVVTDEGGEDLAVAAIKAGATQYLVKGRMTPDTVQAAVVEGMQDARLRRRAFDTSEESILRAITDDLTGLYRRAYFMGRLRQEIQRARRYERALCCWAMEVDGIGQIARVHGRGVADLAVSTVARLLRRYARSTDLVARLEEAEFAAATPETDVKHAVVGVDRLRARVALQVLDFGGATAHVTCSAGVVELTADVADAEDMLRRAREALAQAKAQGGDCVLPPPPGDAELVET